MAFQVLEADSYKIPLRIRIMLKNVMAIDAMLKTANAGQFADYVRAAGSLPQTAMIPASGNQDAAMRANNGGIDLTSAHMNLQTQNAGAGIKFHLDASVLQELQNAPGLVPVIISIQPMVDLRQFLGVD